jgi:hypothetical protein
MTPKANGNYVIAANTIKFGFPLGLALAVSRIVYALAFSIDGLTGETIGIAFTSFLICVFFGIVLGMIRSR